MRPSVNRIDAEIGLIRAMRQHREDAGHEARESLLEAAGALYTRYSVHALESGPVGAYSDLMKAWVDVGIAYDRETCGHEFDEIVFQMYRVITQHRMHVD